MRLSRCRLLPLLWSWLHWRLLRLEAWLHRWLTGGLLPLLWCWLGRCCRLLPWLLRKLWLSSWLLIGLLRLGVLLHWSALLYQTRVNLEV